MSKRIYILSIYTNKLLSNYVLEILLHIEKASLASKKSLIPLSDAEAAGLIGIRSHIKFDPNLKKERYVWVR